MVWNSNTACRTALGHLGLVGRVGGHELGAAGQGAHHRRHLVVVGAAAGEAHQAIGAGPVGLAQATPCAPARRARASRRPGPVPGRAAAPRGRRRTARRATTGRGRPASGPARRRCAAGSRAPLLLHPRAATAGVGRAWPAASAPAARRSRRRRRAAGRRRRSGPGRCPARAWARSCRWSAGRRSGRPPAISAPSRRGWRPSPTTPRNRRAGPAAFSSSSAARPTKSPLAQPTTQPSSAWSGVMPGPSSWPCRGRPASRRRVSRAPSPAGVDARSPARPPRSSRPPPPARRTRPRPRRCSRYRPPGSVTPSQSKRATAKRCTAAASGETVARQRPGLGALHGHDGPFLGDVVPADGRHDAAGVRRVGHDVEALLVDPPHDDVVGHRAGRVQQVGVLGPPGRDLAQVVAQRMLQVVEGLRAVDPHGAEMADVEGHGGRHGRPGVRPRSPSGRPAASPSRRRAPSSPRGPRGPRAAASDGAGDQSRASSSAATEPD